MKNKIIFLISVALLFTAVSAFANDTTEKIKKEIMNPSLQDFKHTLNSLITTQQKSKQDIMNSICNENKYCLKHFELLTEAKVPVERITQLLQNKKNHKQLLYNSKYIFAAGYGLNIILSRVETREIKKLSSCKELKAYIADMPITKRSLLPFSIKYLEKCNIDDGYKDPVINLMDNKIFCHPKLDITLYNIKNLCSLFSPEKNRYDYNTPKIKQVFGEDTIELNSKEDLIEEDLDSLIEDAKMLENIRNSQGIPFPTIIEELETEPLIKINLFKTIETPSEMEDSIEEDMNNELPV